MRRLTIIALLATLPQVAAVAQETSAPEIEPRYVEEINALLADERVRESMAHILDIEPQSRRDLIELTEIPAPPFGEAERAARFAEMLREAGLTDVTIDEEEFRRRFRKSPLWRTRLRGIRRNAAVVLGNRRDGGALEVLREAARGDDPIVAEACRWAIEQIESGVDD